MESVIRVELTSRSIKDLQSIRVFNDNLYSVSKSREIIDDIFKELEILENSAVDFTEIGSVDEEFTHLKYEYRKLVTSHYKITYRKGRKAIYVIRIFDTRQNPSKNK
jgi:plasmid stabilization system protein ParE